LIAAGFVGSALTSDTKLAGTAPDGRALTCEMSELTSPEGIGTFVGRALMPETKLPSSPTPPDGPAPDGIALIPESRELSAAGFVGNALMSETKLLSPGTAPDGKALTWESSELTIPEGIGAFVGSASILEIKLPSPETTSDGMAPDGMAPICDTSELTKPDGRTEPAATFDGRALA
jgi:hypothetical protein